jgi:phosphoribosylformimino-5-aminoimidazole carboxamide ribotide isomerase
VRKVIPRPNRPKYFPVFSAIKPRNRKTTAKKLTDVTANAIVTGLRIVLLSLLTLVEGRNYTYDIVAMKREMTNTFTLYPSIDLRQGKVVRLAQGDLNRKTIYDVAPKAVAERYKAAGAVWLHVVNLDGAFGEKGEVNLQALAELVMVAGKVQFGGGLRDIEAIRTVLGLGVTRAVIGTAAIEDPSLVDVALAEFGPERIAIGVDAREGRVRVKGWVEDSGVSVLELGTRLKGQGVETVVFTDVARDGIGAGVNVESTVELAQRCQLGVIASGGVKDLEDVKRVRGGGLPGLIIGRALYEGQIDLAEAIRITQSA